MELAGICLRKRRVHGAEAKLETFLKLVANLIAQDVAARNLNTPKAVCVIVYRFQAPQSKQDPRTTIKHPTMHPLSNESSLWRTDSGDPIATAKAAWSEGKSPTQAAHDLCMTAVDLFPGVSMAWYAANWRRRAPCTINGSRYECEGMLRQLGLRFLMNESSLSRIDSGALTAMVKTVENGEL